MVEQPLHCDPLRLSLPTGRFVRHSADSLLPKEGLAQGQVVYRGGPSPPSPGREERERSRLTRKLQAVHALPSTASPTTHGRKGREREERERERSTASASRVPAHPQVASRPSTAKYRQPQPHCPQREGKGEGEGEGEGEAQNSEASPLFFFFFFFYLPTGLFLPAQPPILADTPTAPTSKTVRSSQKALSGKSHRLQSVRLSAKPFQRATEQAPEHQIPSK